MSFRLFAVLLAMTSALRAADTVVLLHGLGRTRWSMVRLAAALERDGFRVVNLSYPSRSVPLEQLATEWLPRELRAHGLDPSAPPTAGTAAPRSSSAPPSPASPAPRVHFVTHSMGGIVLRRFVRDGAPSNLGGIVMLAPPNAGSEVSDRLNAFPPFRWFTGQNGRRLGTGAGSIPVALGPWPAAAGRLGVIAGDFSFNPLFSAWLPGDDDGKVSVAGTRLAGMTDHLVLPFSHTWLGWRAETARQVGTFLREGKFARP